jgi:hypothetical protein
MTAHAIEAVEVWLKSVNNEAHFTCGGQSGTGTCYSPSTSVLPCQFHSTGALLLGKMKKKTDHLSLHLHHRVAQ